MYIEDSLQEILYYSLVVNVLYFGSPKFNFNARVTTVTETTQVRLSLTSSSVGKKLWL